MSRKLSRRTFLKGALLASASFAVAACQKKPEGTETTQEVATAGGRKPIRIMLSSWAVAEVPFDQMAREFTEKRDDVDVRIDTAEDEVKVLAQIASGKVEWCGFGIISPFLDIVSRVESGLLAPMNNYFATSTEDGASTLLTDMIPSIKEDSSYNGNFYSLAYSFENITFNWRTDYFKAVGVEKNPATWSEWYDVAKELKTWGAAEQIIPTSFVGALWTDIGALICSAMEKPYTDEGLIDWLAPDAIEALNFFRRLVTEGLAPAHGFDGWWESYQRGKLASVQAQSSRGVWGQMIHGQDKVATSPIPTQEKGGGSGTVYWGNGLGLINKAPYPQELVDFYVYAFGPKNKAFQTAVIKSGKTPIYNSAYTDLLENDPMLGTYKWMVSMRDDVARSLPVPRNTFYLIQHMAYEKWIVSFTDDLNMSAEECAQGILNDSRAEIEKQKVK